MTRVRFTRGLVVAVMATLLLPLLGSTTASAHTGRQSYLYLEIFDDAIAGRVELPIGDLNRVLGLEIPAGGDGALDAVAATAPAVEAYLREHMSFGPADGSVVWSYEFGDVDVLDLGGRSYALYDFEIQQRFDPPPRTFSVSYDPIIEADSDRDGFLIIQTDWGSGTFNNEAGTFLRFSDGDTAHVIDLDDTSWLKGMRGVIALGAEHIRIGTDHILFVLALVLPSVLAYTRRPGDEINRWYPSANFPSTLWRIMKIVTMFTVAHSITLALGGLGYVELPPRLVESIIAISIAAAAIHNIHPVFVNKEWALAFGFGLFHGFGFAGLLSDLGLDRSNRVPSLLGFNIGVELGQTAIILMVFPMLFIIRRLRFYVPLMYAGSVVLAMVALAWATERIFRYNLRVNDFVDPLLRWPRSALLVIAGYAIAITLWRIEHRRGRLVPLVDEPVATATDESPVLVDA
jgi:hypothetical protein